MAIFETIEAAAAGRWPGPDGEAPAGFGRAGMLGYAAGTLGIFAYMRLYSSVPPGLISWLALLLSALALNLLMAALIHLFMDLTGARGSAARLFQAFGWSDYLLALLPPAGIFAKLGAGRAFLPYAVCAAAVLAARVYFVRRLYGVSGNKAALAVVLPYFSFWVLGVFWFSYLTAWLVWLAW